MKYCFKLCLIFIFCFGNTIVRSQNNNNPIIDSLLDNVKFLSAASAEVKHVEGSDTSLVMTLNRLSKQYLLNADYKNSLHYAQEGLRRSLSISYEKGAGESYNQIGKVLYNLGNYDLALANFSQSLEKSKNVNDKGGVSKSYNNIGIIYMGLGDYEKASDNFFKSLKISEEIGDLKGMAICYTNNGSIYKLMNNLERALDSYFKALKIYEELDSKQEACALYNNIASIYMDQKNYSEALKNFSKCRKVAEQIGALKLVLVSNINLARVYTYIGEYKKAMNYHLSALKMAKEIGDKYGVAYAYLGIGELFMLQEDFEKAELNFNNALLLFIDMKNKNDEKNIYNNLSELYQKKGDYKQAYEYHKRYSEIKDTLLNESSSKQITEMNTKYESEKKEKDIQLLTKDKELQKSEIGRQKLIRNGFIVGLLLALILAFVIFNRFQLTRKQKQIIESQNKQIVESINYSKRIQDSLLPSVEIMQQALPGLFVFYLPKNIVSGDFYFFKEFKNYILLACVDCTGHGVPGGFMSTLGSLLLDKIVDNETLKPSEILVKLNDEIIRILHQQAGGEIQDGMDLSVCIIDKHNRKVEFSGARNGIIVVTNNEAKRYKASPLPVGGNYMKKGVPVERNFQTQSISLNSTDWVYMYTDGFIEQIGGQENSPMNYEQFEKQLISLSDKQSVNDKLNSLQVGLDQWRGTNERTDDVLVIGFQLS